MEKNERSIETISKNRLEGLTEGVFSIVMTLLVFQLIGPEVFGDSVGVDLRARIVELLPKLRTYVSSFLVLGIFWVTHHAVFHYLRRLDGFIIWINIIFLMTVALVPLSTVLVVNYDPIPLALVFYGANMFLACVPLVLIWAYAVRNRRLVRPDLDKTTLRFVTVKTIVAPAIFVVATAVSYVDIGATRLIYFLAGAAYVVLTVIMHRKHWEKQKNY